MNYNTDIKRLILLELGYPQLLNLCRVDKSYNKICGNDDFWCLLYIKDFGRPLYKTKTWKENYLRTYKWMDLSKVLVENYSPIMKKYLKHEVMIHDVLMLLIYLINNPSNISCESDNILKIIVGLQLKLDDLLDINDIYGIKVNIWKLLQISDFPNNE